MCIAILKPKDKEIPDEYLEASFEHNKDGAGIAYASKGKLYVVKGIFDKKKFVKAVREAEKIAEGAMMIHCRIGTHGLKDKNNCHPHIVNSRCVLMHNGILNVNVPYNSSESDTIYFIKRYLKPLARDFMKDDAICDLIEKAIGTGNKFVMLNHLGEYRIINEKAGHWHKGIWYSNFSYEPPRQIAPVRTYSMTCKPEWKELPLFSKEANIIVDDEKLINNIKALSNFEILAMGQFPVVDLTNLKLLPESDETIMDTCRYRYLDDLSEEAYEEYCYEIELRGLINQLEEQEELKDAG